MGFRPRGPACGVARGPNFLGDFFFWVVCLGFVGGGGFFPFFFFFFFLAVLFFYSFA